MSDTNPSLIDTIQNYLNAMLLSLRGVAEFHTEAAARAVAAAELLEGIKPEEFVMSKADDIVEQLVARVREQKTTIDKYQAESLLADATVNDVNAALTETAPAAPTPAPEPVAPTAPAA